MLSCKGVKGYKNKRQATALGWHSQSEDEDSFAVVGGHIAAGSGTGSVAEIRVAAKSGSDILQPESETGSVAEIRVTAKSETGSVAEIRVAAKLGSDILQPELLHPPALRSRYKP